MKILLINGKKRSGKDYSALRLKTIIEDMGKTVQIMSFADPIKEIVASSFGISLTMLDDFKNCEEDINIDIEGESVAISNFRLFIQRFGTDAMKAQFGEFIWSDLLYEKAHNSLADVVIVPDFRFRTEYLKESITVKIKNDTVKNDDSHQSENDLNNFTFDFTLDNTNHALKDVDFKKFIIDSGILND